MASDQAEQQAAPKKGPNKFVILGGALAVMAIEAAVVYFIVGMTAATGASAEMGLELEDENDPDRLVEVELVNDRFFNATTGRPFVYNVHVVLQVRQKHLSRVTSDLDRRGAEIKERVAAAIGSAQQRHLMYEPGRETIKRKLTAVAADVFGEVDGEPRVDEVLIPRLDGAPLDF